MVPRKVIEKQHRLSRSFYKSRVLCAFTICLADKNRLFVEPGVFGVFEQVLLRSLSQNDAQALVYLFMPDHCHFLLAGESENADLWNAVVGFKQKTGFWLARNKPAVKWQKDFYDHILRKDEDVIKHIKYILYNPVRSGILDNWEDYTFKGSTVYDLYELGGAG